MGRESRTGFRDIKQEILRRHPRPHLGTGRQDTRRSRAGRRIWMCPHDGEPCLAGIVRRRSESSVGAGRELAFAHRRCAVRNLKFRWYVPRSRRPVRSTATIWCHRRRGKHRTGCAHGSIWLRKHKPSICNVCTLRTMPPINTRSAGSVATRCPQRPKWISPP